jgi:hypothetical protein
MHFGFKQCRQGFIHEAMSLHRFQAFEASGHDLEMKVPFAGIGVTHVRPAVVANFQVRGFQALLQQALDVRGGWIRSPWHAGQAASASVRADNHSTWLIANRTKAAVSPNTLKLTQKRSLMLYATQILSAPSPA